MLNHIETGLRNIRRSPFQAMAAISVLALTFFVTTLIAILVYSSHQVISYFETRPQIIAFLKDEAPAEDIADLIKNLSSNEKVKNVKFVTKEEALEIYKNATSDNPLLSELLSPDIFPASVEFSVNDLSYAKQVVGEVKGKEIVESVGITASLGGESTLGDVVDQLKSITANVRVGGTLIVFVLLTTSFMVLFVVIGLRISMRREEVEILRLIGATAGFIRMPVLFEAIFYGILGVFIGWLSASVVLMYLSPHIVSYFREIPVLPKDPRYFFSLLGLLLLLEMIFGVVIAFVGSFLALARVSKKK